MKHRFRGVFTGLIATVLVASLAVPAIAATTPFSDIPTNAWYAQDVAQVQELGIINGKGDNRFDPQGTLTRAETAVILNRVVNATTRITIELKSTPQAQTFTEFSSHLEPEVCDTVVKADGTIVVLQEKFGLLGWGQGVDVYTGWTYANGNQAKAGRASAFDQTSFIKSNLSNEMYSRQQWVDVKDKIWPEGLVGDYDGEVYNIYYQWDAKTAAWEWIGPNT